MKMKMKKISIALSLVLAISSGALGLRVKQRAEQEVEVGEAGDENVEESETASVGWGEYTRDTNIAKRPLFYKTTNGLKNIPIFITDNAKAGNPEWGGPDVTVGVNGTVIGEEDVSWTVESSSGFEAWLDTLVDEPRENKNLVLLFGSASTGYSESSWQDMQEPLTKKFDALDLKYGANKWILVTNGDGYYGTKSLTDIAVYVAKRGTPVVFVQSDFGGTFPSVEEDGNNYWPPYASGGLFGKGFDHWIPEFKPTSPAGDVTFKGKKHCWGGIAKQGWLGKEANGMDNVAFGAKAVDDKKAGVAVNAEGAAQTVDGVEGAQDVYGFPDKAFLKGCNKMGHFTALESRLAEVIVVGGGAITVEQMALYEKYISLLIETTDKDGNKCATAEVIVQKHVTRVPIAGSESTIADRFRAARGSLSPKSI